jgi:hypothetical protein
VLAARDAPIHKRLDLAAIDRVLQQGGKQTNNDKQPRTKKKCSLQ